MSLGLVGRKVGMTRIFTDDGETVPVTVLDVSNNRVAQVKTAETDGYSAVQVAYGTRRPSRITKGVAGHLGDVQRTVYNLEVIRVDAARQLLLVRGAIPGAAGGRVVVRPAAKGGA